MRQRGKGTILLTGGSLALWPSAAYTALSVGKAALRTLALCVAEDVQGSPLRVGTITVMGEIKPGTPLDPDLIAQIFWQLHTGEQAGPEVQFPGQG